MNRGRLASRSAALALFMMAGAAFAQQEADMGEIYDPPRAPVGEAYRVKAKERGIAVDARTLSRDAPLTLRPPARRLDPTHSEGAMRLLAWIIVGGAALLLIVALLRTRFSDLLRREAEPSPEPPQVVELADIGTVDLSATKLRDLTAMDDPREALRLLLLMGLARAAQANGIALRRSLTARDVFARVPATWRMRPTLEALVRRAELVLFGARAFSRADLEPLIEATAPMLGEPRR